MLATPKYNPAGASQPLEVIIPEGKTGYNLIAKATESKTQKEYSEIWHLGNLSFQKNISRSQIQRKS